MQYDLQDSFLDAAYGLPKEVGRKVWKAVRMLSRNPDSPGLNLEKLHGKADGLWSIRVDEKYRTILLRTPQGTTLLFVGPEQEAYLFAERLPKHRQLVSEAESAPLHQRLPKAEVRTSEPTAIHTASKSRTGKYIPLARHLLNATKAKQGVTLSFRRVEEILKATLPPAARKYRPWWGNDTSGHVQAVAWLSVGWRVSKVSLPDQTVTFELER